MKVTKRQLKQIIRESFEDDFEGSVGLDGPKSDRYRDISDMYYWSQPIQFYWFCSAEMLGWTYYAVVMEDWTGDYFWSVHQKKGKLPVRMSEKTARKMMKRQDVGRGFNSGPGRGKADSLEVAKSRAEKKLDGILLHIDDFNKKYNIPV